MAELTFNAYTDPYPEIPEEEPVPPLEEEPQCPIHSEMKPKCECVLYLGAGLLIGYVIGRLL